MLLLQCAPSPLPPSLLDLPARHQMPGSSSGSSSGGGSKCKARDSEMWFSVDTSASGSWPPRITFASAPCASAPAPISNGGSDEMEDVIFAEGSGTVTGSATRASRLVANRTPIRNRPSRSRSTVRSTPNDLWQRHPPADDLLKKKLLDDLLGGPACGSGSGDARRIRALPESLLIGTPAPPTLPRCPPAPTEPPPPPSPRPQYTAPHAAFLPEQPMLSQWRDKERSFLQLWKHEKRRHTRLPLVVSPFNPLRESMPEGYWRTVNPPSAPLQKKTWNFRRPIPPPQLVPRLRSRRSCDSACERVSAWAMLSGKTAHHCRRCSQDSLGKRLLLYRYWRRRSESEAGYAYSTLSKIMRQLDEEDAEMLDLLTPPERRCM